MLGVGEVLQQRGDIEPLEFVCVVLEPLEFLHVVRVHREVHQGSGRLLKKWVGFMLRQRAEQIFDRFELGSHFALVVIIHRKIRNAGTCLCARGVATSQALVHQ